MIKWNKIKVVIFDLDGTLYNQSALRKRMFFSLIKYYTLRFWRIKELLVLYHFRAEREKRTGYNGPDLERQQYDWCAEKLNIPAAKIRKIVDYWIFSYPNQYLSLSIYPGVKELFETLNKLGVKTAIYSDYKAKDKIAAMGLHADLIVSSTDSEIDRFKPDPAGVNYIIKAFNVSPEECLFVGDREELDGRCAANAGVPYQILDKTNCNDFYARIQNEFSGLNMVEFKN